MTLGDRRVVLCLSLGGTKVQLGALLRTGAFRESNEILWRQSLSVADGSPQAGTDGFFAFLADKVMSFLDCHGLRIADVGVLGVAFPGPEVDDLWQSNNLTPAFRNGADIVGGLRSALGRLADGLRIPAVRVVFDAQCDAGGEVYHRRGRLYGRPIAHATVLNIATGIAAGLVADGRVLVGDAAFRERIGERYDGGAGQLGRHLWYRQDRHCWEYYYLAHGQTPAVERGMRMTERLSGPALAARLLLRLRSQGLLDKAGWSDPAVPWQMIGNLLGALNQPDATDDLLRLTQRLRCCALPVAGALLRWADDQVRHEKEANAPVPETLAELSRTIACEFADALGAWLALPEWAPFGKHIVLTGGVGINFLTATDRYCAGAGGFLAQLRAAMPMPIEVERSILVNATERECYLFRDQSL